MQSQKKQVGKTRNAGYQFGIRRTFPVTVEEAWNLLFSKKELHKWLGEINGELRQKETYYTRNGQLGLVRVLKPQSHIRLDWKLPHWQNHAILQIRTITTDAGATMAVHVERMVNAEQRIEVQQFWQNILSGIKAEINNP